MHQVLFRLRWPTLLRVSLLLPMSGSIGQFCFSFHENSLFTVALVSCVSVFEFAGRRCFRFHFVFSLIGKCISGGVGQVCFRFCQQFCLRFCWPNIFAVLPTTVLVGLANVVCLFEGNLFRGFTCHDFNVFLVLLAKYVTCFVCQFCFRFRLRISFWFHWRFCFHWPHMPPMLLIMFFPVSLVTYVWGFVGQACLWFCAGRI